MSDKKPQQNKKNSFYDFDLFKLPKQNIPHQLKFENSTPVKVVVLDEFMLTTINSIDIEISGDFSNDQILLMDLFAKGIYYQNITRYENFLNFFRSLKCARGKIVEKGLEFAHVLKNAIDGNTAKITILKDGTIIEQSEADSDLNIKDIYEI